MSQSNVLTNGASQVRNVARWHDAWLSAASEASRLSRFPAFDDAPTVAVLPRGVPLDQGSIASVRPYKQHEFP